jgi:pyruvate/2-oxoglutarate dehydrogenase complex dihydrolipoamide dehydrogenase (E3) component
MRYDAIILGFGKAGKTLAAHLAGQGQTVAVVERSRGMYGGTCINVGCIPSKSLVHSASQAKRYPEDSFESKAKRYAAAIDEKRRVTGMLRQKNYDKLHTLPTVDILDGVGSFLSGREVEVLLSDGGVIRLESDRIFINTGSGPVLPDIEGIRDNPFVYTSETLMNEERLPRRLVLIGAGYIGMEFASLYANFGASVTVLYHGERFLPREDDDVAQEIHGILEKQGVRFVPGAAVRHLEGGTVAYVQNGEPHTLEADAVLIAAGRAPATADLHVERAGMHLDARGAIPVDDRLHTDAPGIWALGDVNGGQQFTFLSLDDYRIVASELSGGARTRADRKNVPYSVFMDVPLARVGLTETQAREAGLPIRVLKLPTAAIPKAQVLRRTEGFLKAVVHAETGRILGAALLCPESYEMINLIKLAMDLQLDYTVLRDRVYTHPTMTEALNDLFAL